MTRRFRAALHAPGWLTTLIVMAVHGAVIVWVLEPFSAVVPDPVATPPLVLKLAPPVSAPTPAPPDLAVASAVTPLAAELSPAEPLPKTPLPELLETTHGTLAKTPVNKPRPIEKKQPPSKPKKKPVTAVTSELAARSTPSMPSDVPQAVAPPPVVPQTKADESAALAQGAASNSRNVLESWEAEVLARLASAKRYPQNARVAREQDTVTVSFTVAADGQVGGERILRSAGYQSLEEEALDLLARVSPLPPPPGGKPQRLSLPIDFYLRQ